MRPATLQKFNTAMQRWKYLLQHDHRISANSLIRDAREQGYSYARRQRMLRDIRDLRRSLKLPERVYDPPPTSEDEIRGGHVGTVVRYEEKTKPLTRKPTVHERHLKRLNRLIESYGVEKAYEILGIKREH